MRYLALLIPFLMLTFSATAQTQQKTLSLSATGEVQLPADQVQFNININAEADSPQEAYKLHQNREEALVQLLDEYDIQEEDIRYEPISISKRRNYDRDNNEQPTFQTQQTVRVLLKDFAVYEKIQVGLIENEYDDFSGSFSSTEMEQGKEEALREAIREAKKKASILAEEAGVQLGGIIQITHDTNQPQPYARETMQMKAESDAGSLLKYNQSITVLASVSLQFQIEN